MSTAFRTITAALAVAFLLQPLHSQTIPTAPAATAAAATPVNLVVFSDFQCPFSAELFFTLEKLQARYPKTLHVIYKQSPLDIHPDAPLAHRAALAAGRQGKFSAMAELLYSNQARQDADSLVSYARQLHLDIPRFRKDMASPAVAAQLAADMQESEAFGVNQTPMSFLGGRTFTGTQTEDALATLIDKAAIPGAAASQSNSPYAAATPIDPALLGELRLNASATKGPADAPLTIVEFTDFQCPFCRAAVPPMEQLIAARGRDVRWIVHSFPLDFHPDSELANEAALAAGDQGKFWEMHDLLFANQSALKPADLRTYAQQLHLDMAAFDSALASHKFAGQIAADRALGTRAGVAGTPSFIIDGQLLTGARSLPELNQLADAHTAPGFSPASSATSAMVVVPPTGIDHQVLGPSSAAPLTLTWFTDVRSPMAATQAALIRSLAAHDSARVRVVFKAFPIDSREDSRISAAALLAALDQDKFWPMFDAIAQRRDTLDRAKLVAIAEELHLNPSAFLDGLDKASALVTADRDEATRRGVQGAPVIFLNAQRVDGLQRQEFYVTLLDSELAKAPTTQAVTPVASPTNQAASN